LAEKIIPGYRVIIASVDKHNYVVEWYPKDKRLFLWLPRLHRLNALLHTNIGHELFHPALESFFKKYRPAVLPVISMSCKGFLEKQGVPTDETDLFFDETRIDMVVSETLKIWERGLSEVLCDFGCAQIFGPAAMTALLSMAQCDQLDTCPKSPLYYPPWRFRLRSVHHRIEESVKKFVEEHLLDNRYAEAFTSTLNAFKKIVDDKTDKEQIEGHPLCDIAYKQIDTLLNDGWEYVGRLIPSTVKRWDSTQNQVSALLARIEAGIPPSEVVREGNALSPEAADISAILVAGWVYESYWQQQAEGERRFDYPTFMRLLLKGSEDAALRRAYSEHLKEGRSN
jgi:hypothetical protein